MIHTNLDRPGKSGKTKSESKQSIEQQLMGEIGSDIDDDDLEVNFHVFLWKITKPIITIKVSIRNLRQTQILLLIFAFVAVFYTSF